MAKRMDGTETWFRIGVEVEYDVRYRSFNKAWDHTKKTTGDLDGDNPMYVYTHPEPTHEHFKTYLGPFNSLAMAEKQYAQFVGRYEDNPESYKNLKVTRLKTETAVWEEV